MTRTETLFQTPLLTVARFDHPQNQVHVDGRIEITPAYAITFLRSGEFRIVRKLGAWDFAPGDVLISYPGMPQRVFHPADGAKDECVGIRFEKDLLEDALGAVPDSRSAAKAGASSRSAFQMRMLFEAVRSKDRMSAEGVALAAAQTFLPQEKNRSDWSSVERSFGWYRVRIQRVCELLMQQYASSHSLNGSGGGGADEPVPFESRVSLHDGPAASSICDPVADCGCGPGNSGRAIRHRGRLFGRIQQRQFLLPFFPQAFRNVAAPLSGATYFRSIAAQLKSAVHRCEKPYLDCLNNSTAAHVCLPFSYQ